MIPQEKSEAVVRALRSAFGVSEFEDITPITKGHTPSLVFRIVVHGTPYLMKIITRAEDPSRHYSCMTAAAAAGLAPAVVYTDAAEKISINTYVEAQPLTREEALVRLPGALRALHALPPFPRAPFNTTSTFLLQKGPALDGFLQAFRASGVLPPADCEELFARYAEIAAAYPTDEAELVACHNDLFKPDNILFDGARVWLVDWEAAFLNDPYADLAVVAHQLVTCDDEEAAFLEAYFGAPASAYQSARLHLMRQLAHVFYTMAFLHIGGKAHPVDWSAEVPAFDAYQRRMWAGEEDLADAAVKVTYGQVHWRRLLENVRQPRYREALRLVGG